MKKILSIIIVVALSAFAISSCCGGGQQKAKDSCCESKDSKSCTELSDKKCSGDGTCCAADSSSCCKQVKKIVITAYVEIKPDQVKKFLAGVNDVIDKSKAEEGNLSYNLFSDLKDKNKFVFVEEWKCQGSVDSHFDTEHFKNFGKLLGEVGASEPTIKIFEVTSEK